MAIKEINLDGMVYVYSLSPLLIAVSLILMRAQFKCSKEILLPVQTCRTSEKCHRELGFELLAGVPRRSCRRNRTFKRLNPLPRHIIVNGLSIIIIVVVVSDCHSANGFTFF